MNLYVSHWVRLYWPPFKGKLGTGEAPREKVYKKNSQQYYTSQSANAEY